MRKVFLDTNFVLKVIEWKVDLFGELRRVLDFKYDVVILDMVKFELEKYRSLGGLKKTQGNVALLVLKKNDVRILRTEKKGYTDTVIVERAKKGDVVCTQDQGLKKRLKEKSVPVVVIKNKSYLSLIET